MSLVSRRVVCFSIALVSAVALGVAQDKPATSTTNDPRVGLKAGFRDAGQAIHNLELVASMPKPEGFFDPSAPAGTAMPARGGGPAPAAAAPAAQAAGAAARRPNVVVAAVWTSRTLISLSATPTCSSAISTASTPTTSRRRKKSG